MKIEEKAGAVILLIVLAFFCVSFFIVNKTSVNIVPNSGVMAVQLRPFPEYFRAGNITEIFSEHEYPPLYYMTAKAATWVTGKNWVPMMFLNNLIYLLGAALFAFLIGKLIKDTLTGLLFAVFLLSYPLTFASFLSFSLDFPLICLMLSTVYALLRTEYFQNTGWTVLAAFSCALGMLTKDPFGAYIAGPLSVFSAAALFRLKDGKYKPALNLFLFAVIFTALIWPFYSHFLSILVERGMSDPYNTNELRQATFGIYQSQTGQLLFVFVLAGLPWFIRKVPVITQLVFYLWFLVPNVLLLTMTHHYETRYVMAGLPVLALISSYSFHVLKKKSILSVIFIAAAAGAGLAQDLAIIAERTTRAEDPAGLEHRLVISDAFNVSINRRRNLESMYLGIAEGIQLAIAGDYISNDTDHPLLAIVNDNGPSEPDMSLPAFLLFNEIEKPCLNFRDLMHAVEPGVFKAGIDALLYYQNRPGEPGGVPSHDRLFKVMWNNYASETGIAGYTSSPLARQSYDKWKVFSASFTNVRRLRQDVFLFTKERKGKGPQKVNGSLKSRGKI